MKQIDNRQKQQIQMRAQQVRLHKNILNPRIKEKPEIVPHPSQRRSETNEAPVPATPVEIHHTSSKAGRNDPCPCGSGKKYKKCCLSKEESQNSAMME